MASAILENLYNEERKIRELYEAGKTVGSEVAKEEARAQMRVFRDKLEQDEDLDWIYSQYTSMKERGNQAIDLDDLHRDETVPTVVRILKEYGIDRFTFSSTWSSAVGTMYELVKYGCQISGMGEVNTKYKDVFTDEYEKAPAVVFTIR